LDVARAFPPDLNPFSAVVQPRPGDVAVRDIMSPTPITVTPSTPIDEVARLLAEHKIGAVPVVSAERLVGIITEAAVLRAFLEITGVHESGVRIPFDVQPGEDVLASVTALAARHDARVLSVVGLDHDGRRFAAVRLSGPKLRELVEAVWSSGHRVLSVV